MNPPNYFVYISNKNSLFQTSDNPEASTSDSEEELSDTQPLGIRTSSSNSTQSSSGNTKTYQKHNNPQCSSSNTSRNLRYTTVNASANRNLHSTLIDSDIEEEKSDPLDVDFCMERSISQESVISATVVSIPDSDDDEEAQVNVNIARQRKKKKMTNRNEFLDDTSEEDT